LFSNLASFTKQITVKCYPALVMSRNPFDGATNSLLSHYIVLR